MLKRSSIFVTMCISLDLYTDPHHKMTLSQIQPGGRLDKYQAQKPNTLNKYSKS